MSIGHCPKCGWKKEFKRIDQIKNRRCPFCGEPLEVATVSSNASTLARKKPRLSKAQSKHVVALQQEYKRRHRPVSGPSWRAALALFLVIFLLGNSSGFLVARYFFFQKRDDALKAQQKAVKDQRGLLDSEARRKRLAELAARGDGEFIGSVRGKTYHAKSCKRLPATMNRIFFQSRKEAEELGYRPHSCVKDRGE